MSDQTTLDLVSAATAAFTKREMSKLRAAQQNFDEADKFVINETIKMFEDRFGYELPEDRAEDERRSIVPFGPILSPDEGRPPYGRMALVEVDGIEFVAKAEARSFGNYSSLWIATDCANLGCTVPASDKSRPENRALSANQAITLADIGAILDAIENETPEDYSTLCRICRANYDLRTKDLHSSTVTIAVGSWENKLIEAIQGAIQSNLPG